MAISRSDFYSCSTMLSTLDCIENKTSALCLGSSYTEYTEEDMKIHNELNKDCSHCVQGAPCPEVATSVLLEHIAEPLPCSAMQSSLSSIQHHPHLANESMIEDLQRHFKEFQLLFTALCGTETVCVNGRLLILTTCLQIVWYLFAELHEH
ncbi:uncharacterized protein LOC121380564 [Gigantopelta aegis]|uniref:uncharacterized protein LOC121380564 n=1 Tax=Gigantopelta aegis TaxID=1735272 RepID=UPI001B88B243|nr:uncharacterized protein LOC121380564 [Gigantopelta aegis]